MTFFQSLFCGCTMGKNKNNGEVFDDSKTESSSSDTSVHKNILMGYSSYHLDSTMTGCKTFEDWNKLPNNVKLLVISKMDYLTRHQLSLCSKLDYRRVKEVKINVFSMILEDGVESFGEFLERVEYVELSIRFDSKSGDCFTMRFVEKPEEWGKCYFLMGRKVDGEMVWKERAGVYTDECYEIFAFNIVERFLKNGDFKLERLSINMDSSVLQLIFDKAIRSVTHFQIDSTDPCYVLWWLGKVGPLDSLNVTYLDDEHIAEIVTKMENQTCLDKHLCFVAHKEMDVVQFLSLQLMHINVTIAEGSLLSTRSINQFIKRWIDGQIYESFSNLVINFFDSNFEFEELLEGIEFKKWNRTFMKNQQEFCVRYLRVYQGTNVYQIYNKRNDMTATLRLTEGVLYFFVTGEAHNGRFSYHMPRISRSIWHTM